MPTSELPPLQPHRDDDNQAASPSGVKSYDTFDVTMQEKAPLSQASTHESWLSKLFLTSAIPIMELSNER